MVAVLVLAGFLLWWGSEAILSSTGGNLLRTIDDPAQPGFEALVEPTPVMAVIAVDSDRRLSSVSLLSLTGPGAGAIVVVAPSTLAPDEGSGPRTLADAWDTDGAPGVRRDLAAVLNVGIAEDRVVDPEQLGDLMGPVSPLGVVNPDEFATQDANGQTERFPAGELQLDAGSVATYLGAGPRGERDLARLVRLERFWAGWLAAVGSGIAEPGIIPGEAATGLGFFVRSLAGARVEITALPARAESLPGGGEVLRPLGDDVAVLVSRLVPFPVGAAPDSRLRVRILDGTGQLDNGLPAAQPLVRQGAEVATVGNATRFDYATTQFIVPPGVDATRVERMRAELGVGEVVSSAESASAVDVTVVLGADAVGRLGGPYPPPTTLVELTGGN